MIILLGVFVLLLLGGYFLFSYFITYILSGTCGGCGGCLLLIVAIFIILFFLVKGLNVA